MSGTLGIEKIFSDYKNKIYGLALSISRNDKDAEDILQNTFLSVIKNLRYFRGKSKISTWIYKIAYNEALMVLRKRHRQFRLSAYNGRPSKEAISVNWPELPDQHLLDNELKERIDSAIRHMPIKYRMPLLLHNVQDCALRDTAEVLGLKMNSLKSRLHRANLMIRSEITDYLRDREGREENIAGDRCNTWVGFLYRYAAGLLNRGEESSFKEHIEDCLGCKSFLDAYARALNITKALQCQDMPADLQEKIETFISRKLA